MSQLRIIPLGGMGNVTKNMFAYEYEDEILIVDCGIGFPGPEMLGVDLLLPDISYLKETDKRIVGMLLSHGHDDHIGGLPYILPQLPDFPIFASRLTAGFASDRLRDFDQDPFINVIDDERLNIGSFEVLPIRVTHSIPDTRHFYIKSPAATAYHGSDFKFDLTPVDGVLPDFQTIARVGEEGVDILLSDSLRSEREGFSPSESMIEDTFEREIRGTKGKFVVTLMSSSIHRIQQAIDVAARHGRHVAFLGRSVETNVKTAVNLGFLKLPKKVINKKKINNFPPEQVCVIISGSQGQIGSSLNRAAEGEHDYITITDQDKVVFSTEPIPGNEVNIYGTIDSLSQKGADVSYFDVDEGLHVSGHAAAGEQKLLIALTKPRHLLPIGGTYRHMIQYRELTKEMGYHENQIHILQTGDTLVAEDSGKAHKGDSISLHNIIVDGTGVGDVGAIVLNDRQKMAESGIVVITVPLDKETGQLSGEPEVISRGFVYMKQAGDMIDKITDKVKETIQAEGVESRGALNRKIERNLEKLLYNEIQRSPLILSVIQEV